MDAAAALSAFVTLAVVVDPPGLAPLFIALTRGMTEEQRRSIALRACLVAAGLLAAFGLFGEALLAAVGISMPAFRIAGGILLFLTALDMLFERRTKRREGTADQDDHDDPAVFPLATPLIAGPGSLATIILLAGAPGMGWPDKALLLGIMLAVIALCYVACRVSGYIARALGRTGVVVVTRLLGMLLAALSVQFVIDGVRHSMASAGAG